MARIRTYEITPRQRPTPEQVEKLGDDLWEYRKKNHIAQDKMREKTGFPFSGAIISKIERGGDYTKETHDIVRSWLDEQQKKADPPPKQPEAPPKTDTASAENLGVLLAKITVMAEQINTILMLQQKDHEQVMQLTPYIKHWANIKKRLQLYRYDD